jgi:hypothetical protein
MYLFENQPLMAFGIGTLPAVSTQRSSPGPSWQVHAGLAQSHPPTCATRHSKSRPRMHRSDNAALRYAPHTSQHKLRQPCGPMLQPALTRVLRMLCVVCAAGELCQC